MIPTIIVISLFLWGGYTAFNTLHARHNNRKEQREYEEYVRTYNENVFNKDDEFEDEDEDHDDDEEEDPEHEDEDEDQEHEDHDVSIWKQKRDCLQSSELGKRKNNAIIEENLPEIKRYISNRRTRLRKEKELLLQEEAELESLSRAKCNTVHDSAAEDDENEVSVKRSSSLSKLSLPADKSELSWSDLYEENSSDSIESFESINHWKDI